MVASSREGHYRIRTNPIVRFCGSTPCTDACRSANEGGRRSRDGMEESRAWARLYGSSMPAQKSIVADNNTVLGAPSARLESNGMPQYALLVTLFTVARSASGRPASVVL